MPSNQRLHESDVGFMTAAYRWWLDVEMASDYRVVLAISRANRKGVFVLEACLVEQKAGEVSRTVAKDVVEWPNERTRTLSTTILQMLMQIDRLAGDLALEKHTAESHRSYKG